MVFKFLCFHVALYLIAPPLFYIIKEEAVPVYKNLHGFLQQDQVENVQGVKTFPHNPAYLLLELTERTAIGIVSHVQSCSCMIVLHVCMHKY